MYDCPFCQEEVTRDNQSMLACPNCLGVYHRNHPGLSTCVRPGCAGAVLRSFFDWDQLGVFIIDNTPEDNPVEYPCGTCQQTIRRQNFLLGGTQGAYVCQRCHTGYHGNHHPRQCDLHPGARPNVTHYDGWATFQALGGALTKASDIAALKVAAAERQIKEDEKERLRKLAGRPEDLGKLGDQGEEIRQIDDLVAKITSSEKVGGEPKVSGSTVWLVGHSSILPTTTPVPEGVSITFYSEPGANSDMAGNTFVLETLGGSRPGHFVTDKVVNQMSLGPTKDDEATLGRAKVVEETPNAYFVGSGPFEGCTALCDAGDPTLCDHSKCNGVFGIVLRTWPGADLRIIGCRGTQARGRAKLNPRQQHDVVIDLATSVAQYEMRADPEPISATLQERLDKAGLGDREKASQDYEPSNPQFEGDLRYLRTQQLRRAKEDPATFEASYREMPARARADVAISDKAGVLQNPRFKIADLQADTTRTASQIRKHLVALGNRLLEALDLDTLASDANIALADQAIDGRVQNLNKLIGELGQLIQEALDGPEDAPVQHLYPELVEGEKLESVVAKTTEVMYAAHGLSLAVQADDSIEDKPAATQKYRSIRDSADGPLMALIDTYEKFKQQAVQVIKLKQAMATDANTRQLHNQ